MDSDKKILGWTKPAAMGNVEIFFIPNQDQQIYRFSLLGSYWQLRKNDIAKND